VLAGDAGTTIDGRGCDSGVGVINSKINSKTGAGEGPGRVPEGRADRFLIGEKRIILGTWMKWMTFQDRGWVWG
jgi:hypothetical protein